MILPLHEVDILGVFVAPFAVCLPLAFASTVATLALLRLSPVSVSIARSPLLELATFAAILSGIVLLLGRL